MLKKILFATVLALGMTASVRLGHQVAVTSFQLGSAVGACGNTCVYPFCTTNCDQKPGLQLSSHSD